MPFITHFQVLGYKVYMLIEKEYRVQSQKLALQAKVGILVKYKGASIYQVYIPLQARNKIICSSHVRFNKGGLIIEPDFKAIKDKMVYYQASQSIPERFINQDIKGLYLGPPVVNYIYNSGNNSILVQDNNTPLVENNAKSIINAPEVSILPPPPSSKKKRYPKELKNYTTDNTPLKNQYITRFQGRANVLPVILTTKVNNFNNKIVKDKGNTYYIAFLAGSKPLKDLTILAKALLRLSKEADKQHKAVLKEYYLLQSKSTQKMVPCSSISKGIKVLGTKLVFKTKYNKNSNIIYRKACLIIYNFEQVHSRDFNQTFTSVYKSAL